MNTWGTNSMQVGRQGPTGLTRLIQRDAITLRVFKFSDQSVFPDVPDRQQDGGTC
jgi:hypothetical protein